MRKREREREREMVFKLKSKAAQWQTKQARERIQFKLFLKNLPMTGFEPWISSMRSDRSTN